MTMPQDISIYAPMIDMVKELYGDDLTDEILIDYLHIEFDLTVTLEDIKEYRSSIVAQEEEDTKLIFQNIGF